MFNSRGERLEFLIDLKGLRKEEVARRANISVSTLNRYQNDSSNPRQDTIICLADILDTNIDFLCGRTDNFNPPDVDDPFYCLTEHQRDIMVLTSRLDSEHNARLAERALAYCEQKPRRHYLEERVSFENEGDRA